ncbi:protein kinase 4 [Drosophila subpulchrella]|uniref:protein kinase 4 n=1 Tax=Drosophila subpulchrella TaxID=1486046 RepID=UPI0018A1319C|nr:protein kinase 4 [Drosophila subpulchrella]XP_037719909.1 protein kinase 4 [Drosophila subpulchrella]
MHFWIDKRSQQCGFGRSRVAASLSHAGSGLSYGHPPRRTKSSSCSSNNAGGSGQSMPPVHRSLPQTPYDLHQPGTSRQLQSQSSYGNNNSQQQHHMLQQHSSGGSSNNNNLAATGTTTTASNNNNASGIASSAAVLTGSGTIVPLVARGSHYSHHGSTRYQPRSQQQQLLHQQQQQQQHQQQQHQQQQHYSYHHPQFGNMAVPMRHYDAHQQQQYSGNVYADDAYSAYHHTAHHQHSSNHSTSGSNNQRQSNAYATPRRHNSSSNMRHSAATTATSAAAATSTAEAATMASPAATVAAVPAATTHHSNQLQQQHHALLQHADSQLLPGHLKCGMCASLVLASVFVAGTKFYFDHQGTGLEVLIFCAFSATFFLAACLVSLCRIPKGLLSSSSRSDGRAAVSHSRGVNSSVTGSGSGAAQSAGCLLEMTEARYLEELQMSPVGGTTSTAGPPPYHIAILLPEQTPATMGKQLPLDESPPPSYDKILV